MKVDPDLPCPHEDFNVFADVNRLTESDDSTEVIAYSCDLRIRCDGCGEHFRFIGVPAGMSPAEPRCSVDEKTLSIPIRPASSDPDFGLGIPGYAIQYRRPE